jgi:hypothetical protein
MNQRQQADLMLNAAELGEIICTGGGAKNSVHLLESLALGLRNQEIDEEHTEKEPACEEKVQPPVTMLGLEMQERR